MRDLRNLLAFVLALGTAIAVYDHLQTGDDTTSTGISGRVVRVVDGDSLYLDGLETQIRLFGVDAPERDEPGYGAAKATLTQLVLNDALSCTQVDEDRYNRIVGRCFMPDGREVSQVMIDSGTTDEYCRFSKGRYGHC